MKRLREYKSIEKELRKAAVEIDKKIKAEAPMVLAHVMKRIEQEERDKSV